MSDKYYLQLRKVGADGREVTRSCAVAEKIVRNPRMFAPIAPMVFSELARGLAIKVALRAVRTCEQAKRRMVGKPGSRLRSA